MAKHDPPTLAQWRTAVEGAATEIATRALSFAGATVHDPVGAERASAMVGAHLPLIGEGSAYDLAVVSSPDGCRALARAILMAEPNAALRDTEVADAIGEIVNMFGGGVKKGFLYGETAAERPCLAIKDPISVTDLHATILQQMTVFVKDFDDGTYQTYGDLLLNHYIVPDKP